MLIYKVRCGQIDRDIEQITPFEAARQAIAEASEDTLLSELLHVKAEGRCAVIFATDAIIAVLNKGIPLKFFWASILAASSRKTKTKPKIKVVNHEPKKNPRRSKV